jgi:hypothetical protein
MGARAIAIVNIVNKESIRIRLEGSDWGEDQIITCIITGYAVWRGGLGRANIMTAGSPGL